MRLYYMTSLKTAVEHILPERRMRLAQFDTLNDPFELLSAKMSGPEDRMIFRKLFDHWNKTLGIFCMGKRWTSPLMWAHYAQSHTGVCLGFDIPDGLPREMHYEPKRLENLLDPAKPLRGLSKDVLEIVISTKYEQWSYEEEWRVFSKLLEPDPINGKFYVDFGPSLTLREIIVGARCKNSIGSFKKLVGKVDKEVTIIKARPAFETFTMVRQKRVTPITVSPK